MAKLLKPITEEGAQQGILDVIRVCGLISALLGSTDGTHAEYYRKLVGAMGELDSALAKAEELDARVTRACMGRDDAGIAWGTASSVKALPGVLGDIMRRVSMARVDCFRLQYEDRVSRCGH